MHKLFKKVDAIELKARQVIHKIENLERENSFLIKENNKLKRDLNQYIDKIEGLQKAIALDDDDNSPIDKEAFKRKIDQLIEEVAACIDILST